MSRTFHKRREKLIIGLTGPIGAGKRIVADYLKEQGFAYFSLSTLVREEAKTRGVVDVTREMLQDIGNDLRRKFGNEVLARRVLEKISAISEEKVIVHSIRNPFEVRHLKSVGNFYLIGVVAPEKVRFERILKRGRSSDPKIWEEFKRLNDKDLGVGQEESGQQVGACLELADFTVNDTGPMEEVRKQTEEILAQIFSSH